MTQADNTPKRLPDMNRRGFVGAAAIGVGAAWAAPAVISMPASGSSNLVNSPPPTTTTTSTSTSTSTSTTTSSTTTTTRPGTTTTTRPGITTTTDDGNLPATTAQEFPPDDGGGGTGGEGLPRTGFDVQDPLTLAFGLIAAGGAMQVWSTQRARLEATALPVEAPGEPGPTTA